MNQSLEIQDPEYMTIAEFARLCRCSKDTIRRKIAGGALREIDWVDFFDNGKLRATRESVERFLAKRHKKMEEVLGASLPQH